MVSPLIFGAWVTATYRQYKNIIIEAWVQVPENDEVELKVKRILDPNVGENGIHYSLGTETESKFKSSLAVESEQDNFVNLENNDYSSICSTVDNDLPTDITVASEESVMTEVIAICNDRNRVTERQRKMHKCAAKSTTDSENEPSCCLGSADLHASEIYLNNPSTSWKPTKQIIPRKTRIPPLDDIDLQSDGHLNDTHRGSNDTEKDLPDIMLMNTMGTGRKFNYEKYIKYIEITSGTIGFSIAGVVITLDRVSFFCGMLLTFVGVFAQTAILKAGRTNVQRVN